MNEKKDKSWEYVVKAANEITQVFICYYSAGNPLKKHFGKPHFVHLCFRKFMRLLSIQTVMAVKAFKKIPV